MTQTFSKHLTEWLSCYSKDGVRATATAATRVHVHVWFCSTCSGLLTTPPPLSHSFSFACFPDTVSSASPRPQHAPLLSTPHPSLHPSSRSPACSSIQAPNRIRRDGRLDIHKLSIHHQRGGGGGGGGEGCVEGRQGHRKRKEKWHKERWRQRQSQGQTQAQISRERQQKITQDMKTK